MTLLLQGRHKRAEKYSAVQRKYQEHRQIMQELCVHNATSEMHITERQATAPTETRKAEETKSSTLPKF